MNYNKLGILGGGQLGRMMIQSAINYNISTFVLDPDPDAPCKDVSSKFFIGDITDFDTVYNFGQNVDVITIEIENVNADALEKLQQEGKQVFPQPDCIRMIQDKSKQKAFFRDHNFPTSDFIIINNKNEIAENIDFLPCFQKLSRAGYDGKGVVKIENSNDISKGFDTHSVLEKLVDIQKEIAILVARNIHGEVSVFDVVEMVFHKENNLLDYLMCPSGLPNEIMEEASSLAMAIINKMEMVGILAVEMFLTKDGKILVNELAPRPHNSGHHTINASFTSQYEQHLRAIFGLPLGSTKSIMPSAMINLLGETGYNGIAKYVGLEEILKIEGVFVHLYGKKFTKPHRKMGHVTILDENPLILRQKLNKVKDKIKVIATT